MPLVAFSGLLIGSFLNVVIYRLPKHQSIIVPASHCPKCGTSLQVWDLVPVFSFLLAGGRCRYCAKAVSRQYPLVELLTAFLFSGLYRVYGLSTDLIIYIFLGSLLIIVSFIDLNYQIIPNKITLPALVIGLILSLFGYNLSFSAALIGVVIPGGFFLLIALIVPQGLGMGDVKLVAMLGAWLGFKATLIGIFSGALLGSIIGLTLLATGRIERRTRIPFGPLISLGMVIVLLFPGLVNWYFSLF